MAQHESADGRLKVLIVPEWYPWDDDPGQAPWAREHARIVARESDVAVVPSRSGGVRRGLYELAEGAEDGLRTVRVRYRDMPRWMLAFPLRLLGIRAAMRRLASDGFVPDVIHAHVFYAGFAALLLRRRGTPVIVSEHFTGFPRGLVRGPARRVAKWTFERATLVCPVSDDLDRHITALGIGGRRRTMPNVVDTHTFAPPAARGPSEQALILNVASLHDKKGHVFLLDALAAVGATRDDWRLHVIGDGPLRGELEAQARALGLADRVAFLGPAAKREVAAAMGEASFLVLPSLFENAPLVVIEALASGLPVIASAVGGVPDMLDERFGTLVAPGDSEALAAAIERMLDAYTGYDSAAMADRARARYGDEAVGNLWLEVYREVARQR